MAKKQDIISDASIYSSVTILTQIITLIAGILTRRFLGPAQTGVWALLQIILIYAGYALLGVTQAINREIPFYRGKGDHAKAEEIKNLVYSFSTLVSLTIAIGCVIYAFLMREHLREELFYGLIFVSALIMLQRSSNLNISFLRGYKLFTLAAKQMVLSAIVNALLVVFFSYRYQVYGFMIAMCLSFLFNIFYIKIHYSFDFKWYFDLKKIGGLIRYGAPLVVVSLLSSLLITIDKLMIAKILGIEQLGLYSVALLTYAYLNSLPKAIGIVLVPNFHQKFGETDSADSLKNYLEKSSQVFEVIMPLLIATGWFLIPYFARLALPDFEGSIPPMKYLITSVYWIALLDLYGYFLVVIRKQLLLLPIIGATCVLAFFCNLFALTHGFGILGVGIVTTIVFFCNFSANYFLASKYLPSYGSVWQRYLRLIVKFGFMITALVLLNRLFQGSDLSFSKSFIQLVIFILLCLPFLHKLNKDLKILSTLKNKFFKKMRVEEDAIDAQ